MTVVTVVMGSESFNPESFLLESLLPLHARHARPDRADYVRRWHREARKNRRREYLEDKCCLRCGAGSFLEIHHRDPNQKVDHRHIWHWSKKRREEELAKCDVLCDVCHDKEKSYTMMLRRGWRGWRGNGRP